LEPVVDIEFYIDVLNFALKAYLQWGYTLLEIGSIMEFQTTDSKLIAISCPILCTVVCNKFPCILQRFRRILDVLFMAMAKLANQAFYVGTLAFMTTMSHAPTCQQSI
jgi:uncharacterized membrane protein YczE